MKSFLQNTQENLYNFLKVVMDNLNFKFIPLCPQLIPNQGFLFKMGEINLGIFKGAFKDFLAIFSF